MTEFLFIAKDENETDRLGAALAAAATQRGVIGLSGTLGAGKTRFVQAIAAGFGIVRHQVVSPTFVLCQEYRGRTLLYHLDAYRVRDDDEFLQLGVEEMFDSPAWVLIEWAERIADCLPRDRLDVEIEVSPDESRRFVLRGHGEAHEMLVERVRTLLDPTVPVRGANK